MLVDFEEEIVNELSDKSNNLDMRQRYISPMILPTAKMGEDFHLVSSGFWERISKQYPASMNVFYSDYPIITFAFKEYDTNTTEKLEKVNGLICPIAERQIQIIFCTDKTGSLFIGFFPQNADLLELIRLVMK
jgi:hypothetical protein